MLILLHRATSPSSDRRRQEREIPDGFFEGLSKGLRDPVKELSKKELVRSRRFLGRGFLLIAVEPVTPASPNRSRILVAG